MRFGLLRTARLALALTAAAGLLTWRPAPAAGIAPTPTPTRPIAAPWCPLPDAEPRPVQAVRPAVLRAGRLVLPGGAGEAAPIAIDHPAAHLLVSPKGEFALAWDSDPAGKRRFSVLDLEAGAARPISLPGLSGADGPVQAQWAPGRGWLAYLAGAAGQPPTFGSLRLADPRTGRTWRIVQDDRLVGFVFSPDGRQIALLYSDRLDLVDSAGGQRRANVLPGYAAPALAGGRFLPPLVWLPDSSGLRVALPAPLTAVQPQPVLEVWEIPTRGFPASKLDELVGEPYSLRFSPDGQWLAYLRSESGVRIGRVARVGGGPQEDAAWENSQAAIFLGWAPDARQFAYWNSQTGDLWVYDLCEGARLLATVRDLARLEWAGSQPALVLAGAPEALQAGWLRWPEPRAGGDGTAPATLTWFGPALDAGWVIDP